MERLLFVLTSHAQLGRTGRKTGTHLAEITHPYEIFRTAGFDIDFVSPQGGRAPLENIDLDDSINDKWLGNEVFRNKIESTLNPEQVVCHQYKGIFYPGGHGALWDLPTNERLARCAAVIHEQGGMVGSVCQGAAGLLPIKIDGQPLVQGREIVCFSNREENTMGFLEHLPFLLEDALNEKGALLENGVPFQRRVVISGQLITGQNPASARAVAEEMRNLITHSRQAFLDVERTTLAP